MGLGEDDDTKDNVKMGIGGTYIWTEDTVARNITLPYTAVHNNDTHPPLWSSKCIYQIIRPSI